MALADTLTSLLQRLSDLYAYSAQGGAPPNLEAVQDGVKEDVARIVSAGRQSVRAARARMDLETGRVPDAPDLAALTGYTPGWFYTLRRTGGLPDVESTKDWIRAHCPQIRI